MPEGYSIKEAKEAIDGLGKAFEDFKKANDDRIAEIQKNGKAPAELEEKVDKINSDVTKALELKDRLDKIETASKRQPMPTKKGIDGNALTEEQVEYKKQLSSYLRKGDRAIDEGKMRELAQKALSVQSDPDGGYFVSPDTSGRISTRIFETSPLRSVAAVQAISTDALEGVIDDDEAGAEWTGSETSVTTNTDTPQVGTWRIPVHEMATKPKATQKLLDDSEIDIEAWLMNKVIRKFARTENAAFVDGDGVSKPRGFNSYADASDEDVYERGKIGTLTSKTNDALEFDDIIDLYYLLKAEWRVGATWAMNRNTQGVIRKLKDSNNQYLWEASLQIGQPAAILGRPIVELNDMPDVGDGTLPVAFADWGECYQIVDRLGIATLRDPYSSKPFVEFYTRRRVGGDVVNWDGIKRIRIQ